MVDAKNLENFQNKFPRCWWALDRMDHNDFKSSMLEQVKLKGNLSQPQLVFLWRSAFRFEKGIQIGTVVVPMEKTSVDVEILISRAERKNNSVGVTFVTPQGWWGKFTATAQPLMHKILSRDSDRFRLKGSVNYCREMFVLINILDLSKVKT